MKLIKYKVRSGESDITIQVPYDETVIPAIIKDAIDGEYTIEDDGQPEVYTPTTEERLAALEAAQLEMLGVIVDG